MKVSSEKIKELKENQSETEWVTINKTKVKHIMWGVDKNIGGFAITVTDKFSEKEKEEAIKDAFDEMIKMIESGKDNYYFKTSKKEYNFKDFKPFNYESRKDRRL